MAFWVHLLRNPKDNKKVNYIKYKYNIIKNNIHFNN